MKYSWINPLNTYFRVPRVHEITSQFVGNDLSCKFYRQDEALNRPNDSPCACSRTEMPVYEIILVRPSIHSSPQTSRCGISNILARLDKFHYVQKCIAQPTVLLSTWILLATRKFTLELRNGITSQRRDKNSETTHALAYSMRSRPSRQQKYGQVLVRLSRFAPGFRAVHFLPRLLFLFED